MMAQPTFPPGMGPGHPGMGGPAHPMAAMQHPGGHMGGHPPGMMQGMHPGVSGPQVTQGPMVTGMPQGPGTPAPGHMPGNSMAMAHLGGPQQHMFQQQNPQMNFAQMNPGAQQQLQHQAMLRQRMMQQMQQSQQGMPMNMPNNPNFNQAQLAQMKMNMPLQQQMQQMQQNPHMQQFRNQQHQQQIMAAHAQQQQQQAALAQQQRQAQQMQLSRSQGEQQQQQQQQQHQQQQQQQQAAQQAAQQQTSQPPQPHPTPAPQVQPQSQPTPQPQPTPSQTPVPQNKAPPPHQAPAASNQHTPQQPQPQNQSTPQIKPGENEDEVQIKQQDPNVGMMMPDLPKEQMYNGHAILQLIMFQDSLACPSRPNDIDFWNEVINKHFSPMGQLKMQLFNQKNGSDKSYLLQAASLARFYHAHFVGGIKQIHLSSFEHIQNKQANGQTIVSCSSASLMYVFANDIRVSTSGSMLVLFDEFNKIVRLDLITAGWQEFIPRNMATAALAAQRSPIQNVKQSPKAANKNVKKVQQQEQPEPVEAPSAGVSDWGIPTNLLHFLEIVEVCLNMTPLMEFYWTHGGNSPFESLQRMNQESSQQMANVRMQNQVARQANSQMQFPNQGGMNGPNQFASPGMAHLGLPQSQGSPHLGGPVHTPSPAQNVQGGVPMMHQMSAQGSNLSGSQGPSTNTSPNVSNKRRRPSTVKVEDDNANANQDGNQNKVKPSPRIGGKRQKAT